MGIIILANSKINKSLKAAIGAIMLRK